MCGILFLREKQHQTSTRLLHQWVQLMTNRGPDHQQCHQYNKDNYAYSLGASRLRITDRHVRSDQPFFSEDKQHILLFNGEIYNYHDLRNKLLNQGHTFNTSSDTETLLHWLMAYKEKGLSELRGIYSFAYTDTSSNFSLIVRDTMGIKPLFYSDTNGVFMAASDLKPLTHHPQIGQKINTSQISHYLKFQHIKRPNTIFENIQELEPGHYISIKDDKISSPQPFLHNSTNIEFSIEAVQSTLTESIILQTDVTDGVGLLLSGGVDSTLMLALAKQQGLSLRTYSLNTSSSGLSSATKDDFFARKAAEQYRSEHFECNISDSTMNDFGTFIQSMDQPIGDSGAFVTWIISRFAAQNGERVLLSGAGADEYWGGYRRHIAFQKYLRHKRYLPKNNNFALWAIKNTPFLKRNHKLPLIRLFKSIATNDSVTYQQLVSTDPALPYSFEKQLNPFDLNQALAYDRNQYLISDVLALSDKSGMANSIEIRVPYLDEHLVSLARNISADELLQNGPKWVLKSLLESLNGHTYARRKKEGFGLPFELMFQSKSSHDLWAFMHKKNHPVFDFIQNDQLTYLKALHLKKYPESGRCLWAFLTLAHWLEYTIK